MKEVVLPKEFYKKTSILKAIEDFSKVCKVAIREDKNNFYLLISDVKTETETEKVVNEFLNYILGLMLS